MSGLAFLILAFSGNVKNNSDRENRNPTLPWSAYLWIGSYIAYWLGYRGVVIGAVEPLFGVG